MNNFQEPLIIRSASQKGVAFLEYSGMHEPTWAHVRAEMYLFHYNLRLLGRAATQRRFFSERCVPSPNGDYLAIEEYDTDGTAATFDRVDVKLIVISTERAEEALVSRQKHGRIRPVRFEAEKIIYDKSHLAQYGAVHHFERSITDLDWHPLE